MPTDPSYGPLLAMWGAGARIPRRHRKPVCLQSGWLPTLPHPHPPRPASPLDGPLSEEFLPAIPRGPAGPSWLG